MKSFMIKYFFVIVLLVVAIVLCFFLYDGRPELEVGQVWVFKIGENPFSSSNARYQHVLELRDGWVRYEEWSEGNEDHKYVSECTESWFMIGSELFKDKPVK